MTTCAELASIKADCDNSNPQTGSGSAAENQTCIRTYILENDLNNCFIDPIGFSFIGYPPDKFVYRNTWKGGLGDIYEIDITNVTVNDTNFIIELSEGKIEISLMSSNLVLVKNLRKGPFSARDVKMDDFFYGQENNSLLVSDDTLSNFKRIPEPDCVL